MDLFQRRCFLEQDILKSNRYLHEQTSVQLIWSHVHVETQIVRSKRCQIGFISENMSFRARHSYLIAIYMGRKKSVPLIWSHVQCTCGTHIFLSKRCLIQLLEHRIPNSCCPLLCHKNRHMAISWDHRSVGVKTTGKTEHRKHHLNPKWGE